MLLVTSPATLLLVRSSHFTVVCLRCWSIFFAFPQQFDVFFVTPCFVCFVPCTNWLCEFFYYLMRFSSHLCSLLFKFFSLVIVVFIARCNKIISLSIFCFVTSPVFIDLIRQAADRFSCFKKIFACIWSSSYGRAFLMSGKNRTGAKSLPRLLYCPDQMLPVMMLSNIGFRPKT